MKEAEHIFFCMDDLKRVDSDTPPLEVAETPPNPPRNYGNMGKGRPKGSKNKPKIIIANKRRPERSLQAVPSLEKLITKNPMGFDPAEGDRILALIIRIQWERFLRDTTVELSKKAAVGVQIAQHLEGSKGTMWVKDTSARPETMEDLEKESALRESNIQRMLKYIKKPPTKATEAEIQAGLAMLPKGEA